MAEQESVYLWSTTALTNASSDPAVNFAEGQLPGTLNNSNRAVMAAVARFVKDTDGSLTTAGSANAYTLTINGRMTPLATGQRLTFKASFSNTAAATLAVTNADAVALGTKAIRGPGDVALLSNVMISGGVYDVRYDTAANSAAGAWILLNPSGQIVGTGTNDSAIAGSVGEYISASVAVGSAVALTTATAKTVTSISLTAGDWDVWANASFHATGGSPNTTDLSSSISTTNNALAAASSVGQLVQASTVAAPFNVVDPYNQVVGPVRISLSATTTHYLTVVAGFTTAGISAYGIIAARRAR